MAEVGVADMITMDHLTEEMLLSNLDKRFKKDIIYVCFINNCIVMKTHKFNL